MFQPCEICHTDNWKTAYEGPVRAGAFGKVVDEGKVAVCGGCGVARLAEEVCIDAKSYETEAYRVAMAQGLTAVEFFSHADPIQIHHLKAIWPLSLRGKVIADIGCGAGSFIDHVAGLASQIIAIEPTALYHDSLLERNYQVFSYAADAVKARPESVDFAVSFQVIEHVLNPRAFTAEIAALLKPGGYLLIATPNRDDILMKLLPEEFPPFFYRVVHRWYFDRASLRRCVEAAGVLRVETERFLHTYGMSNALSWMKERQPVGNRRLPGIDGTADTLWNTYLEASGQADTLFILAQKPGQMA